MNEQHSIGWFRARLGNITGSRVGELMRVGKKSPFSDTAMNYIYQLAAERTLIDKVVNDDYELEAYIQATSFETRAMRFGTEMESVAREYYCKLMGVDVHEVGSCSHFDIPHFASSPDGITENNVSLEIKCPSQYTFMKYCHRISDAADLFAVVPEYYYQCMAHMMCAGTEKTHFIAFSPFQQKPIHIVPVYPDDVIFKNIEERVTLANQLINEIISTQHPIRT